MGGFHKSWAHGVKSRVQLGPKRGKTNTISGKNNGGKAINKIK
jgi:hypothetical protein